MEDERDINEKGNEIRYLRNELDSVEPMCTTRGTTTRDSVQSNDVGVQFPDRFEQVLAYKESFKVIRLISPINDPPELMPIEKNFETCTQDRSVQIGPIAETALDEARSMLRFLDDETNRIDEEYMGKENCLKTDFEVDLNLTDEVGVSKREKRKSILKKIKRIKKEQKKLKLSFLKILSLNDKNKIATPDAQQDQMFNGGDDIDNLDENEHNEIGVDLETNGNVTSSKHMHKIAVTPSYKSEDDVFVCNDTTLIENDENISLVGEEICEAPPLTETLKPISD
ncbi:uncharacterized protein LOC119662044 [Teleopsis dalmanni]|uniref:uncharacterized protein LOC119662044 n=1 Tax=Teleopsis dalmanni TaxID=139649 RepID=UPI0018CCB901|nr:uncharacterized protein LOC119662044 [Teleopsis dalmanni]